MPLNRFFPAMILAALTALWGPANAQAQPLDITCTASPLDDWPAQRLITDDRVLCRVEGYDIRIEMTGTNRILTDFTSDGSHILQTFRLYRNDDSIAQPVTLHTLEFSDSVIEFYLRDGTGERLLNLHRQFIWTRDLAPRSPARRSDTAVVYGASQSVRCSRAPRTGDLTRCMAARTVMLCDSALSYLGGPRVALFPVLTAQSFGPDASRAVLTGFEDIAQVLERMQTEILDHLCVARR